MQWKFRKNVKWKQKKATDCMGRLLKERSRQPYREFLLLFFSTFKWGKISKLFKVKVETKILDFSLICVSQSYYKKKGVIYWSLLHSQRWCVRDIWYFLTTLQLVCFRMRYDYHFYHRHRFRKKQQITIFFCFVETTSQFNVFLASILAR